MEAVCAGNLEPIGGRTTDLTKNRFEETVIVSPHKKVFTENISTAKYAKKMSTTTKNI